MQSTQIHNFRLHDFLKTTITPPYPEDCEIAHFAVGCFWGAERLFWNLTGVYTTAVGYAGGNIPNPNYHQVCSGRSGHTETVQVVFQPKQLGYNQLLNIFWESHNPTQGMRQGNDVGSQYRSVIFFNSAEQQQAAEDSKQSYQAALTKQGHGEITTAIQPQLEFWFAEPEHQQYLYTNPNGYCGLQGCGISCNV